MDDNKLKSAALTWLYEMEILNAPSVLTNLKENVLFSDTRIIDCELLILEDRKELLVYIQLNWWNRLLKRERMVSDNVLEVLNRLLPSFRKRIVTDRSILDLALKKVRQAYGGFNEKIINDSPAMDNLQSSGNSNLLSDQKEQPKTESPTDSKVK